MNNRQRGGLVYWERQGADRMCALHCLNSLLQGPYFTEAELSSIGMELDQKERQLMAEGGTQSEEYRAFIAEGSGNLSSDGYFNISVLIECLRRKRINCIGINYNNFINYNYIHNIHQQQQQQGGEGGRGEGGEGGEGGGGEEEEGIDFGYILNHKDHWIAIRKIQGVWYNLDSMKSYPCIITREELNNYLYLLNKQGYTAFLIKAQVGHLPLPGKIHTKNNQQFYLTQQDIQELRRRAAEEEEKATADAQRIANNDHVALRTFLANTQRNKTHEWPQGGGYRLNEDTTAATAATTAAAAAAAAADVDGSTDPNEDPELQEAIRLSMECYRKEVEAPGEEPTGEGEEIKLINLRFPTGKRITRKFTKDVNMTQIFKWVIYESHNNEGISPLTALSSFSLAQTLPRRRFCWTNGRIFLFVPPNTEGEDITEITLEGLGFQSQEQFMLQL